MGELRASGPAAWRLGAFVPAVLGLVAAGYLTIEHYRSSTTFACPESATVNCAKVTTSSYSHFAGVPVALGGLIYFVAMIALLTPAAWRLRSLDPVRVGAAAVGVLSVFYLLWAELFRVDAICLWCSAVHLCTIAMFAGILWYATAERSGA